MKIGIIGSGMIGGTLGIHFAKAGHHVMFSSRNPEKLRHLVRQAGPEASSGSIREATAFGEVLLLAIPHAALPEVSKEIGEMRNKVIIDATNYYPKRDGSAPGEEALAKGYTQSEWTASFFPHSYVVKAFNTIYYLSLQSKAFSNLSKITIPIGYNNNGAGQAAQDLIASIGFETVRVGTLGDTQPIEPDQEFYGLEATKEQFEQKLAAFKGQH